MQIVRDYMPKPKTKSPKESRSVRLHPVTIAKGEIVAERRGYGTLSDYIRKILIDDIEAYEKENGIILVPE